MVMVNMEIAQHVLEVRHRDDAQFKAEMMRIHVMQKLNQLDEMMMIYNLI